MVLDLDHFKYINDSLGHRAGDELIVARGALAATALRESDTLARIGGDELALAPARGRREGEARHVAIAADARPRQARRRGPGGERGHAPASASRCSPARRDLTARGPARQRRPRALRGQGGRPRRSYASTARREAAGARSTAAISWSTASAARSTRTASCSTRSRSWSSRTGDTRQYELLLRCAPRTASSIAPAGFLPVAERYDLIGGSTAGSCSRAIAMLAEENRRGRRLSFEVNISGLSLGDGELLGIISGSR